MVCAVEKAKGEVSILAEGEDGQDASCPYERAGRCEESTGCETAKEAVKWRNRPLAANCDISHVQLVSLVSSFTTRMGR